MVSAVRATKPRPAGRITASITRRDFATVTNRVTGRNTSTIFRLCTTDRLFRFKGPASARGGSAGPVLTHTIRHFSCSSAIYRCGLIFGATSHVGEPINNWQLLVLARSTAATAHTERKKPSNGRAGTSKAKACVEHARKDIVDVAAARGVATLGVPQAAIVVCHSGWTKQPSYGRHHRGRALR